MIVGITLKVLPKPIDWVAFSVLAGSLKDICIVSGDKAARTCVTRFNLGLV